ncbi:rhomboid family intramembrane serine protease [uncultured Ruminococcus sp.]|uniref:rhomboid family intramembrane serine protease n=1 Tax=uncultured Ruminococcus sp. TaxID=165186 RepID=UPI002633E69C|nr:rhomboid family intramembrane serine protease [uncultured Ruminococcus sp.]
MLNQYLEKLERKFGRFAISNLMLYIVLGMGVFAVADVILTTNPDNNVFLLDMIRFDKEKIMHGEVWRVISFVLEPPDLNMIFLAFALYFYWMMGSALEQAWGSFRFNIFYFSGVIGCIIAGFILGSATNYYLYISLFIAFAILYPDEQIMLFFFIPIKVKWLGLFSILSLLAMFIVGDFQTRIFLLLSLVNLLLFFGKDLVMKVFYFFRRYYYKWFKNK